MGLDKTECICAVTGLAAIGFILNSHHRKTRMLHDPPTACSARLAEAEPLSSRAATVEPEEPFLNDYFSQPLSENFEESMRGATMPNGGPQSEATRRNLAAVQTQLSLEPTLANVLGSTPLVAGRCPTDKAPPPPVTGGVLFNISEAYAAQLPVSTQ